MFNPLRRLKFLPWIELLQAALVTIVIASAIDYGLLLLLTLPALQNFVLQVLNSPLGVLISLAATIGVGALGVVVLERGFRQVILTNSTLWALVPCLALWLWLHSFLPIPFVLIPGLSVTSLVFVVLGVFWKGRRYWR